MSDTPSNYQILSLAIELWCCVEEGKTSCYSANLKNEKRAREVLEEFFASRQRELTAAQAEIADLRAKCERLEKEAGDLSNALRSKALDRLTYESQRLGLYNNPGGAHE